MSSWRAQVLPAGRSAFRADIQALRAFAVAGVVIYHLWPHALPGGFVGVDVFFVISGFLITQHLATELTTTGRISLRRFWARRIRRLLPAAFTVLGTSLALLVVFMPRLAWPDNLSQIRAAATYVENWLLGAHSVDYLSADNSPSLVQHYWSLSVEEQFYLLWPLLLLAGATAAHRVRGARLRGWLVLTLALATAVSFVVSLWWTAVDQPVAFFATPPRAWEFGVGGLVALRRAGPRHASSRAGLVGTALVGAALLCWSYVAIDQHAAFPGWIAALPVAGAALVIRADVAAAAPAWRRLLSAPPLQWLGDNSYSIYLWHWPLIVAAPWIAHGHVTDVDRGAIAILSCTLAALTKQLVEDPVRSGVRWHARPALSYAFAVTGVVALFFATGGVARDREPPRSTVAATTARVQTQALVAAPRKRSCFGAAAMDPDNACTDPYRRPPGLDTSFAMSDGRGDPCLQNFDAATPSWCTFGAAASPRRVVALVGNSHAWRLIPALALYADQHKWELVVAARINCLGLITTPVSSHGASTNCLSWSAQVQQHLLALPRLDAVMFPGYRYAEDFLAGTHATAEEAAAAQQQVLATWSTFAARGTRVVVPEDVPGMRPTSDPVCLAQTTSSDDPCSRPRTDVVRPSVVSTWAQQRADLATFVPTAHYFCDAVTCHAVIGGVVVYFDSHHLTTTYARSLARYLGADVAAAISARPAVKPVRGD